MHMPWTSLSKAKKAGAITNFRKKPISLSAVNKLYDIYDTIKADSKKVKNPMAVAMSTWKGLLVLKNDVWILKPPKKKKESKETKKDQVKEVYGVGGYPVSDTGGVTGLRMPAGSAKIGDGSMESFKDILRDALKALFGKTYLYIISTYRTKVFVDIDDGKQAGYYEVPYTVKKGTISFGTPIKVVKLTKFQKAEQKAFKDYRESIKKFVTGKGTLAAQKAFKDYRESIKKFVTGKGTLAATVKLAAKVYREKI
jgi:hypothetical protein